MDSQYAFDDIKVCTTRGKNYKTDYEFLFFYFVNDGFMQTQDGTFKLCNLLKFWIEQIGGLIWKVVFNSNLNSWQKR